MPQLSIERFVEVVWSRMEEEWEGSTWFTEHAGELADWADWAPEVHSAFLYPDDPLYYVSPPLRAVQVDSPIVPTVSSHVLLQHPLYRLVKQGVVRVNGRCPMLPSADSVWMKASRHPERILFSLLMTLWCEGFPLAAVLRLFSAEYHEQYERMLDHVSAHAVVMMTYIAHTLCVKVHACSVATHQVVRLNLVDCDGALYNGRYFAQLKRATKLGDGAYHMYSLGGLEFSHGPLQYELQDPLVYANPKLLAALRNIPRDTYSEIWFGTNRQTLPLDLLNSHKEKAVGRIPSELAHCALPKLADYLKLPFRDVTLEDLWRLFLPLNVKERFDSYKASYSNQIRTWLQEDSALFDPTKIALIYRAAHEAVKLWPGHEIGLHLFDDRLDILRLLQEYFILYSDRLPYGTYVYLHVYNGVELYLMHAPLAGTGPVNYQWEETVRAMQRVIGATSMEVPQQSTERHQLYAQIEAAITASFVEMPAVTTAPRWAARLSLFAEASCGREEPQMVCGARTETVLYNNASSP